MKKTFLLIVSALLFLCSCNFSQMERDKARKAAKDSGIKIDSIIFGICFNDSPTGVMTKLKEWESHCSSSFEFHFQYPKRLNEYSWSYVPHGCYFYNDSLYSFLIRAKVPSYKLNDCLDDLDSLYSHKYGKSIRDTYAKQIDWYQGNLNISVRTFTSPYDGDNVSIDYINYSHYNRENVENYKSLDEGEYGFTVSYGKEYWNRTYKEKEESLKNEASKGI